MKETFYFSHDYNVRSDEKIKLLIRKHGMSGYGIFWSIIEDLYNNTNVLRTDYDGIAYDLRTNSEIVKSIINDFGLFTISDELFGSVSVERRISERNVKSVKAKESVNKRWQKYERNTNVNKTEYDSNTIKESKVKESKVNKKEKRSTTERQSEFYNSLIQVSTEYPKEMTEKFYNYWSEITPDGKKMKFELEKTWELSKRLAYWKSREKTDFRQTNGYKTPVYQKPEKVLK